MPRARKTYCILCEDEIETGRDIHPECKGIIYLIRNIYESYKNGNPPKELRDFICELDFVFEEDPRKKAPFDIGAEVIIKSIRDYNGTPFNKSELPTLKRGLKYEKEIFEILQFAKVCRLVGNQIVLGEYGKQICNELTSGGAISDVAKLRAEIKGIITIVLANTWLEAWEQGKLPRLGTPRNFLKVFSGLGRLVEFPNINVSEYLPMNDIFVPKTIGRIALPEKQLFKLLKRLCESAKLIESFIKRPTGFYAKFKSEVQNFILMERERLREERARGR